jgi:hypothetical protein
MRDVLITLYAVGTVLEFSGAAGVHLNDGVLTFVHKTESDNATSTKYTTNLPYLIREDVASVEP